MYRALPYSNKQIIYLGADIITVRDVEAVYLQRATASTPIVSASKQIQRNFASKIRPVRW